MYVFFNEYHHIYIPISKYIKIILKKKYFIVKIQLIDYKSKIRYKYIYISKIIKIYILVIINTLCSISFNVTKNIYLQLRFFDTKIYTQSKINI